jgi:hypothetical protein
MANEVAVTDDTPDVLGPVPVEALTGLLIGAPTAGVSPLFNNPANANDGTSEHPGERTEVAAMVEGSSPFPSTT